MAHTLSEIIKCQLGPDDVATAGWKGGRSVGDDSALGTGRDVTGTVPSFSC